MYDRKKIRSAQNVMDVSFFVVTPINVETNIINTITPKEYIRDTFQNVSHYEKDTSVTFWAERFFSCHTYDTSMTIIMTKPGIIIDVVGSYFYDKKS